MNNELPKHAVLVQHLTRSQGWLYGYILELLPDIHAAKDVLQQTNLIIWRKADEFNPSLGFSGWASRIAHFQVLSHLRDKQRDKHCFHDALLNQLAEEAAVAEEAPDRREIALRGCLEQLRPKDKELILARYAPDASVQAIAGQLGKTVNAVSRALFRIRGLLGDCVEHKLASESH